MGDVAITVREVAALFEKLKKSFAAKDQDFECEETLAALKKKFIHFPTFLAPGAESATRVQEVMLVRETLEHALLLSARNKDLDVFESYFAQLRVYYHDTPAGDVPPSERRLMIVGLNLMRLLVSSRIAEFHSELERIEYSEHANLFVRMPVQLERYLMEGSYNKLLNARSQVPSNEYLPIVEMLESTVRLEIAGCIPKTYPTLGLAQARKLLMLPDDAAAVAFGEKQGWEKAPGGKGFVFTTADDSASRKEIPFKQMLAEHIEFAAQLQRVV